MGSKRIKNTITKARILDVFIKTIKKPDAWGARLEKFG
jgi:hypothetical protein